MIAKVNASGRSAARGVVRDAAPASFKGLSDDGGVPSQPAGCPRHGRPPQGAEMAFETIPYTAKDIDVAPDVTP
jgi:hypothetical protein